MRDEIEELLTDERPVEELPVARRLKERTGAVHERVEAGLGLLDGELSAARLRTVLSRFLGFWRSAERQVDEWAVADAGLAAALSWPRRRRGEILRHDLLRLGVTGRELAALPEAPPVLAGPSTAQVLGWLYVAEGSTLGGAVIDRSLRGVGAGADGRIRTFTPYLEGPGPMWRAYLEQLQGWVGADRGRCEQVVEAGHASFLALERWLAPIAVDEAA